MRKKKKYKTKCLHCGKIYNNYQSCYSHLRTKHKKKFVFYMNDWERIGVENTKSEGVKAPKKVLTPETRFVDIPIILRIPITLGTAQIVAED